ncbi:helix-turn-helix domain-containing protein [Ornithinibacillus contaminans]|uniref:helix-turn-helix domain-containing protein n=1 Tax=Ornithinibacillus contaminans TaxID=694055 RepID=UPI00064DCE47|nr:AraC family transcriptional regulator [Ornithinibacillus contaminans]
MRSEKEQLIIRAISYMKEHLDEELTSEELASHIGYSPYHFSRVFKEITGVSPRHYLSALRIEAGKELLVDPSNSILKTLLNVGFRSIGTFSSKFKQFVGLSPKQFQKSMKPLHQFINEYDFSKELQPLNLLTPSVTCRVVTPTSFKGIVFIGLFPRPIPDQEPIVGTVLNHQKASCTFSNVPIGTYYILATTLPKSLNPKSYFVLTNTYRGKGDSPVVIEQHTSLYTEIVLREPLPFDPPILINLPKLLLSTEKRKQEEK